MSEKSVIHKPTQPTEGDSMTAALDLDTLHLDTGSHRFPEEGVCLLEATAATYEPDNGDGR